MRQLKVFGVGFHKTATSSLAQALSILGYQVTGPNGVNDPDIKRNVKQMAQHLIGEFDAFQDNPWPLLYQDVDLWCPGSKFILTLRPSDKWIKSVVNHFSHHSTPMREWIYGSGSPIGNEAHYLKVYEAHNQSVIDYFRGRPDDLLVLRITEGQGWRDLCPFLHMDAPTVEFPNINKTEDRRESHRFG
ncbi:MAG: sulfotransferase [Mariprofundaceae bacterium]